MKVKKQKSWQEKLEDNKGLPKVEKITERMSKIWGSGTVVIPPPKEVDEIMRRVGHIIEYRKGKKEAIVRDFEKYLVRF